MKSPKNEFRTHSMNNIISCQWLMEIEFLDLLLTKGAGFSGVCVAGTVIDMHM